MKNKFIEILQDSSFFWWLSMIFFITYLIIGKGGLVITLIYLGILFIREILKNKNKKKK